jgi:serine protease Do
MQSVSQGIISARGRHVEELPDIENQDFLQTDAAINPGNSGGPLVNMKGEVIGINNSIASNGGGNEGVGFSIPINLARWIMGELVAHGHVSRGALGVDLNPEFRQEDAVELGLERPRGARILVVYPLSPAARGGLQDGDVVLRFGGVEIVDLNHLINAVSMAPIGEVADLVVWRDRRELKLKVTIGERDRTPSPSSPPLPSPSPSPGEEPPATRNENPSNLVRRPERPSPSPSFVMGLELATLNANAAKSLSLPEEWKGAVIVRVDNASPLAGICQVNDVISSVDGQVVASAEKAVELLNARGDHGSLTLGLDRLTRGVIERRTVRVP